MDLKQQMTGTLGRNQIVFSSVSFFYAGTNPSSPAPLGLQQSMSRSSRSVTVFSLSLSYSMRHHGNSGVGPVPNLSQLWKFRQENGSHENGHLCVKKGGKKKKISWEQMNEPNFEFFNFLKNCIKVQKSTIRVHSFDDFVFKLVKSMNRQEEINFLPFLLPTMFFFSLSRCCHDQTAALYTCVGLPRLLLFDLCST